VGSLEGSWEENGSGIAVTELTSRSSLPKSKFPGPELGTAFVGSLLAGFGVVALFCTVGVYV
jgi:hypothetical protein